MARIRAGGGETGKSGYADGMSRALLTAFGAFACGASFWVVLGSLAAVLFSRMPGGAREGGGAVGGHFIVGPMCGLVGLTRSSDRLPDCRPRGTSSFKVSSTWRLSS